MKKLSDELKQIIDSVGKDAIERKELLKSAYKNVKDDDISSSLKWYRSRKNSDIKDALTLEGIKRGFSVHAEKTMGAFSECCSEKDQCSYNRFDLSWANSKNSRDFTLAVEIEMDLKTKSILEDFKKLLHNKSSCLKIMVCQAKGEHELNTIKMEIENTIANHVTKTGQYLISIWLWSKSSFVHYEY